MRKFFKTLLFVQVVMLFFSVLLTILAFVDPYAVENHWQTVGILHGICAPFIAIFLHLLLTYSHIIESWLDAFTELEDDSK